MPKKVNKKTQKKKTLSRYLRDNEEDVKILSKTFNDFFYRWLPPQSHKIAMRTEVLLLIHLTDKLSEQTVETFEIALNNLDVVYTVQRIMDGGFDGKTEKPEGIPMTQIIRDVYKFLKQKGMTGEPHRTKDTESKIIEKLYFIYKSMDTNDVPDIIEFIKFDVIGDRKFEFWESFDENLQVNPYLYGMKEAFKSAKEEYEYDLDYDEYKKRYDKQFFKADSNVATFAPTLISLLL